MTRVYGYSDDLIEIEGDIKGEEDASRNAEKTIISSDGTMLCIVYGDQGIWKITILLKGPLFDRIDICLEENDEAEIGYSDVAYFKDGIEWISIGKIYKAAK